MPIPFMIFVGTIIFVLWLTYELKKVIVIQIPPKQIFGNVNLLPILQEKFPLTHFPIFIFP